MTPSATHILSLFVLIGCCSCTQLSTSATTRTASSPEAMLARSGLILSDDAPAQPPLPAIPLTPTPPPRITIIHPNPAEKVKPAPAPQNPKTAMHLETAAAWKPAGFGAPAWAAIKDASNVGGDGKALQFHLEKTKLTAGVSEKTAVELRKPVKGGISGRSALKFDVYVTTPKGAAIAVAIKKSHAPTDYYESEPKRLKEGWNRAMLFPLGEKNWKSSGSNWEFSQAVPPGQVNSLIILLYQPDGTGICIIDKLQIDHLLPAGSGRP